MSIKTKEGKDPLDGMTNDALLVALSEPKPEKGASGGLPPALMRLIELRYAKELAAEQQAEEELRRLKEAQVAYTRQQMENIRYTQEVACDHRKENGRPRIGGQRLSNGHITFVCQFCNKTWEDRLPGHLQVDLTTIGG